MTHLNPNQATTCLSRMSSRSSIRLLSRIAATSCAIGIVGLVVFQGCSGPSYRYSDKSKGQALLSYKGRSGKAEVSVEGVQFNRLILNLTLPTAEGQARVGVDTIQIELLTDDVLTRTGLRTVERSVVNVEGEAFILASNTGANTWTCSGAIQVTDAESFDTDPELGETLIQAIVQGSFNLVLTNGLGDSIQIKDGEFWHIKLHTLIHE